MDNSNNSTSIENKFDTLFDLKLSSSYFNCDICYKNFDKKKNLQRHLKLHNKEAKFKCKLCEKSYTRSDHLNRHLISHSADKKPFKCDLCIMRFSNKSHLKRHVDNIHNSIQHKCDQCNFSSDCKTLINKHKIKDHKALKYECPFPNCTKVFTVKKLLKSHIKRFHDRLGMLSRLSFKKISNILNLKNNFTDVLTFDTRLFYCGIDGCKKAYSTKFNLKVHTTSFHRNLKEFKCGYCDSIFNHKCSLKSHLLKKHSKQQNNEMELCSRLDKIDEDSLFINYNESLKEPEVNSFNYNGDNNLGLESFHSYIYQEEGIYSTQNLIEY